MSARTGADYTLVSWAQRPDLAAGELDHLDETWPEFLLWDTSTIAYWERLGQDFAEFQFLVVDCRNAVVGRAHTIPLSWNGSLADLPGGLDDVLVRAFSPKLTERDVGGAPRTLNAVVALEAILAPAVRHSGLSTTLIEALRAFTTERGYASLLVPVRPTEKHRYPLTPMERYVQWRQADGLAFDPWIRLHERVGGQQLALCEASMTVSGTVREWQEWTGMQFPETGSYVVPGALVPVAIDREHDQGVYVEPNVWLRHSPQVRGVRGE
jgi:hypothetical protein